jgi:plastocyanin
MRPVLRGIAALSTAIILAACSGSTPTSAPAAATNPPAGATVAAAICADSSATPVVSATVENNTWSQPVSAKVNDVITWTNNDSVPHRVELDNGQCKMDSNIAPGTSKGLTFSVAGTYPFHCSVHPTMKGTITIS